jgi:hypothetical protein
VIDQAALFGRGHDGMRRKLQWRRI